MLPARVVEAVVERVGEGISSSAHRLRGPALAALCVAALCVAASCVIAATAAAAATAAEVKVVGERAGVEGCDALGEVRGSSLMGMILDTAGWEAAVDEMKERALALGATHLLLQEVRNGFLGSNGRGEAFACPPDPIPAPAPRTRRRR